MLNIVNIHVLAEIRTPIEFHSSTFLCSFKLAMKGNPGQDRDPLIHSACLRDPAYDPLPTLLPVANCVLGLHLLLSLILPWFHPMGFDVPSKQGIMGTAFLVSPRWKSWSMPCQPRKRPMI